MKRNLRRLLAIFLVLVLLSADICAIAEAAATLTLPSALQIIDEEAFYGNTSIEKVIVPDGTTGIRSRAFADSSMTELVLPDSLTFIAEDAFEGCGEFALTVPEDCYAYDWAVEHGYIEIDFSTQYEYKIINNDHVSITKYIGNNSHVKVPEVIETLPVKSIAASAFANCDSLVEIVLPTSLTSIDNSAFYSCDMLESITLPESLTSIGGRAFASCSSLKALVIPDAVTSIGESIIEGDLALEYLEIGGGITEVTYSVFKASRGTVNSALKTLIIHEGVTTIGEYAFSTKDDRPYNNANCHYKNLETVELPSTLTTIERYAFANCSSLKGAVFSEELTSIGAYAFSGCSSLSETTIPASVENIGQYAFSGCSSMETLTIASGNDGRTIGDSSFSGCKSVLDVVIPEGFVSMGSSAFSGCDMLESITLPESLTSIGGRAFASCSSLKALVIPDAVTSIGESIIEGDLALEYLEIGGGITEVTYSVFKASRGTVNSALKTLIIHEGVTTIGEYAFSTKDDRPYNNANCHYKNLETVELPSTLTTIERYAFANCTNLDELILPESVIKIGNYAFSGCINISNHFELPKGLKELGSYAFANCVNSVYNKIIIPQGVTTMPTGLFSGCNELTKLILPKGITSISGAAFPIFNEGESPTIYAFANSYADEWLEDNWDGDYRIYTRESTYYGGKEVGSEDENIQATWEVIDKYKNSEHHQFDIYLEYEEEYPPYLFELFVQGYQGDIGLQASVATSEIVNAIKNGVSDTVALTFGDIDIDSLWALLDEDKKVAQAIVDYLVTADVNVPNATSIRGALTSDEGEFFRKWLGEWASKDIENVDEMIFAWNELVKWKDNALARLELEGALLSTEEIRIVNIMKDTKFTGYSDANLAAIISEMEFVEASTGKTYVFADMLDINSGNARSISKKISSMAKQTAAGKTVSFKVDDSWGTNVKWWFRVDVEKTLNPNNDKTIYEFIEDKRSEVESKARELETDNPEDAAKWNNKFKIAMFSKWIFDAVLEGMDAYEQVAEYEAVLAIHEKELRSILKNTDCKNIEAVVDEVLAILREGTANSIIYAVEEGTEKLFCDLTDDMVSDTFGELLEKAFPKVNIYTMFFDFGTDVAMLLCDASNTKLKVWGVEDLYDDYQAVKQDLIDAMEVFYADPTLDTFNQLYYTAKYYALIVRSSSNQVSIILKSDAESITGLIQSFFDKISVEERIEDAKDIPVKDDLKLITFLDMLFPMSAPI